MLESRNPSKRHRDPEAARRAILDAAQAAFAAHGYDGARFDTIAAGSGYNRSLICQYFRDKENLYLEVIRRADRDIDDFLADLSLNLATTTEREELVRAVFGYLTTHTEIRQILAWEAASDWRTYRRVIPSLMSGAVFPADILEPGNLFRHLLVVNLCLAYFSTIALAAALETDAYENQLIQIDDWFVSYAAMALADSGG